MMCLLHTGIDALTRELERDSTELLALLEERDRHGYELAQRIDQ
jgi:DNA-binding PadR family transcriptional regulator